jgi:integrase/recombinase XerD
VHLIGKGVACASLNQSVSALLFFYGFTLGRKALPEHIPYAKKPKILPIVLSAEEVARLLDAMDDLTRRVTVMTALTTGMRTGEVVSLRIEHIESNRGLIRIVEGNGAKDCYVMLSDDLLDVLRSYWEFGKQRSWLFPNPNGRVHSIRSR